MAEEIIGEFKKVIFDETATDEELIGVVEDWIKESQSYHDWLLFRQKKCEDYYLGIQTDRDLVPAYLTNVVENRIFEGVETIIPIISKTTQEFVVFPGSEKETSVERAKKLSKVLEKKYDTIEMPRKLEEAARDMLLYRFGVLKWEWDFVNDDVNVRKIDPRLILIPKLRCDPHDLPYKMELQEYTPEEIEDYFPNIDIESLEGEMIKIDKGRSKTAAKKTFDVLEVWTPYYMCWYMKNKILKRQANPYFDFKGTKTTETENEILKFSNFLDFPRDPYVFFTTYQVNDEPIGSASLAEIAMPIQDEINVQKRQIVDNLRRMGNSRVIIDSDAMSEEEVNNITNEPGLIIRGRGLASENKVKWEAGVPLESAHFDNLLHSESKFDDLFGVHPATRGASGSKTLGGQILSKQQDTSRIELLTRVMNRGVQKVAEGLVQLMKMFYTEINVVKILGEEGALEFVKLNSEDIEQYIEIDVETSQVPEMDKLQMRNEAVQLWQLGAIDPLTLFERLEFPDPVKAAERLLEYKTGQQLQKLQMEVASKKAGETPPGTPGGTSPEKAGRKVETPQNVLQRATQNLGGQAPIKGTMPQV